MVTVKRIYEPVSPQDGRRVLVDGLWPRGLSRARAHFDEWAKEVAPSAELRKWYGHRPELWAEFEKRYRAELAHSAALGDLRKKAAAGPLTLLTSTHDPSLSHAEVLRKLLERAAKKWSPVRAH